MRIHEINSNSCVAVMNIMHFADVPIRKHVESDATEQRDENSNNKRRHTNNDDDCNDWIAIKPSDHSLNTINPIRCVAKMAAADANPAKSLIQMHIGDPSIAAELPPCAAIVEAVRRALDSCKFNGYGPAVGLQHVRESVASFLSRSTAPITADDVIMTSGCSHGLQMAIEVFANCGDNILVPMPTYPLYATLMRAHGIEDRSYNLQMETCTGLVDLAHLESQIDKRTRAIIVNNPSNPTGSVFPRLHLEAILRIAHRHRIPIIADEIYGDLTFDGAVFYPMATLKPSVPIISCDSLAKRYLVPGWRLGWMTIHDPHNALVDIRQGLQNLANKIDGPCTLIQAALPDILTKTPASFFERTRNIVSANATIIFETLSAIPGLKPIRPYGTIFCMVGFDVDCFPAFGGDGAAFVRALLVEEAVYCLSGITFNCCGGWFRLLLIHPEQITKEACTRIRHFCNRHYSIRDQLNGA